MPDIQIVKLQPDEWLLYRQFRLGSLQTDPQAFGVSYADMLERPASYWRGRLVEAWAGENSWLLFARDEDRLVGMIGAHCEEQSDEVELIAVYVSPDKRGQGIGRLLMYAILAEICQKGGFKKAVLGVNSVQAEAVALYRRYGFTVVREEQVTRADGEVRLGYFMEKELI